MSDLGGFFSQADRIAELEVEVADLKRRLYTKMRAKSWIKVKYDAIKPPPTDRMMYKKRKAANMVMMRDKGEIDITLAEIGKQCGFKYGVIRSMAYRYRAQKRLAEESLT